MSLIELLVVISIIGIVMAIAVPQVRAITDAAGDVKTEQNAKNIVNLLAAAKGAGAPNTWTAVEDAIDDLENGLEVQGPDGVIEFRISPLKDEERLAVAGRLEASGGMIHLQFASN